MIRRRKNDEGKEFQAVSRAGTGYRFSISFRITVVMLAATCLVALLFEYYLRHQYIAYIAETAEQSDSVVLDVENEILQSEILSSLQNGAELSIDDKLITIAEDYYEDSDDANKKLLLSQYVLNSILQDTENLFNLAIVDREGTIIYQTNRISGTSQTGRNVWNPSNQNELDEVCERLCVHLDEDTVPRAVFSTVPSSYLESSGQPTVVGCRNLLHIAFALPGHQRSSESVRLMLVLSFELESVSKFFNQIEEMKDNYTSVCICDENETVLYSSVPEMIGSGIDMIDHYERSKRQSIVIGDSGWTINILLNMDELSASVQEQHQKGIIIFGIAIFAIILFQFLMMRYTLRPIRSIGKAMKMVRKGVWKTRIPINGSGEIWQLADNYNDMADAIEQWRIENEKHHQEKIESIKQTANAQMKALQSQINAHFLCNTLTAINMSVMEQGNEEASLMIRMLSNIMRYAYSRNYESVTLYDEAEWVEQYLKLQKFRLMDRFDYLVDLPVNYLEWPCCKLFLQPFVENSIKHGFAEKESGCFLSVTGEAEGRFMKIMIEDNGCGMSEERKAVVEAEIAGNLMQIEGTGIGVGNVAARLRLFYGQEVDIRLYSEQDKGTRFEIYLPLLAAGDQTEDNE